jgi:hypothetical protein
MEENLNEKQFFSKYFRETCPICLGKIKFDVGDSYYIICSKCNTKFLLGETGDGQIMEVHVGENKIKWYKDDLAALSKALWERVGPEEIKDR